MSFSLHNNKAQFDDEVIQAINNDDDVKLYMKARQAKENGEDEQADKLEALARKAQRNTWSHDEARDEALIG